MTKNEHLLNVIAIAQQMQFTKTIIDILKRENILQGDDPMAFHFAARFDVQQNEALLRDALAFYLRTAKGLGIVTGLEGPQAAL
jgi:hypothetical protein